MSKVAVVSWTMGGNTEAMAQAVAKGARTEAVECSDFSADQVAGFDALAFGCPTMGSEELDPDLEELFNACVPELGDRPVALFGSYDWGDGEWMRTWEQSAKDAGVNVVETYITHLEPDDDALAACEALGAKLAG